MIKYFCVYKPTGEIIRYGSCPEEFVGLQVDLSKELLIETDGTIKSETHYIENNIPTLLPAKPEGFYSFNYELKQWEIDSAFTINTNRAKRNKLLQESDWTQLTDVSVVNKEEWQVYREKLREMTDVDFLSNNFPTL